MKRLELHEHKKLVLKNILKRELKAIHPEMLSDEINKFANLIELLKVQTFGPLVIKSGGTNIGEGGEVTTDYDIFVQANDFKQYKNSFSVMERLEVPNCLYIRFEGRPEDMQYAHSKLDLFSYENNLEAIGDVYSIVLEDTENHTIVDIFYPLKQR